MVVSEFAIRIEQIQDYEFRVRFDKPQHADLVLDEPPPLGRDAGPNPARVLAAAIADCLCASLVFCAHRKLGLRLTHAGAEVKVQIVRNENKRLRIGRVEVVIDPGLEAEDLEKLRPCLGVFEDFCTVTQSIRQGLDVRVGVKGLQAVPEAAHPEPPL